MEEGRGKKEGGRRKKVLYNTWTILVYLENFEYLCASIKQTKQYGY